MQKSNQKRVLAIETAEIQVVGSTTLDDPMRSNSR